MSGPKGVVKSDALLLLCEMAVIDPSLSNDQLARVVSILSLKWHVHSIVEVLVLKGVEQ